jgi:phage terminase large subunit
MNRKEALTLAWKQGHLKYKFHSGQDVIENKYSSVQGKLFVANVSRRFGKSTWACIKALEMAIRKPKSKSIIATAFQTDCENIILPIINDLLSDCPQNLMPQFNKTKKRYNFKNGSSISIVGLDKNPNSLRGNKLDGVIILDEAAFIGDLNYIYSSIIVPATMYSNTKVIVISTPPISPEHPFKNFCEKAESENAYVKLTIHDNPMVTPDVIEEYRKECLTETDFQREYLAEFVTDKNLHIIPEFKADNHIIESGIRDEFFQFYRKYICFDIGVIDPTAFLFAYYDWKKQVLVIEAERKLEQSEVLTKNINQILTDTPRILGYSSIYRTIADSNNLILIQDLNSEYGKSVVPTSKDSLLAMISEVRIAFQANKIVISRECKNLISQLKFGVWNKHKTEFSRMNGHHNDFIAALVYMIRSLQEYTNPIPADYGYTQNTWNASRTDAHRDLKKIFNL